MCGTASAFFFILGIIIMVVRKNKNKGNMYDDYDLFSQSDEECEEIKKTNATKENLEVLNDKFTPGFDVDWI